MTTGTGPLRVLVVDDEPAIRRFLRAGLSSQGYIVSEIEEGLPAVDIARRFYCAARHRQHVVLHQAIHPRDPDGRE